MNTPQDKYITLFNDIVKIMDMKKKIDHRLYKPTDEELKILLKLKIQQLEEAIGLKLYPEEYTQISFAKPSKVCLLDHYPVIEVKKVTCNGVEFKDYELIPKEGVIHFNRRYSAPLKIEYVAGLDLLSNESNLVNLFADMIQYDLQNKGAGNPISIKERTTVVAFDSSTSLGADINKRLDNLKAKYACGVKLL